MQEFHQSFWDNTWTLMERQNKVTMRNTGFLKGRGLMVNRHGSHQCVDVLERGPGERAGAAGVLFQAVLFLSLGQAHRSRRSWLRVKSSTNNVVPTSTARRLHTCFRAQCPSAPGSCRGPSCSGLVCTGCAASCRRPARSSST
ncbi:hypothetical protein Pcac1_g9881 [Phytophthora cactorum]|nr:hypothetical protein Pcac1_g9881 [Phytophthora cactorum]